MPAITIGQAFDRAVALHQAGQLAQAEAIYRQLIVQVPQHADAMHLLGLIAVATGHADQGADWIRKAISHSPVQAVYHANLGVALHRLGRHEEALASLTHSLALAPGSAETLCNLGEVLHSLGRSDEALANCRRALALRPDYPDAHNMLGVVLVRAGEPEEAIASYRAALALRPGWADAQNNLGCAFLALKRWDEAEECFRLAVAARPDYERARGNLEGVRGVLALKRHAYGEAIAHFQREVEFDPDFLEPYANLAACFLALGRFTEATDACRHVLARHPDFAAARWNLALVLLLLGRHEEGWREYEWRWQCPHMSGGLRGFTAPQWDGTPAPGRTILLHAEQGFGDAIQFLRYLPVVRKRAGGARLIVECHAALARLFAETGGWDAEIIPRDDHRHPRVPPHDFQIPFLSLPFALGMAEPLPIAGPYLRASDSLSGEWRQRLTAAAPLRVGIAWEGNPAHHNDLLRSIPFASFAGILRVSGVTFYRLQPAAQTAQSEEIAEAGVMDLTPHITDFADTAALMAELDLIITVDTAAAHLAGALGRPVWTLLPFVPDWRWGLEKEDTPWYPTMRLFRQPAAGDWDSVVRRVAEELRALQTSRPGT